MERNVVLSNGVVMPHIGYGVFRMTDLQECEEAVFNAIKAGYRLIDTATAYGNEEAVGRAIARAIGEGIVTRDELFVTTKLWITDTSYEGAKRGFAESLKRLVLEYIDLYVIHQPYNDYFGAWKALEELYDTGKVRAIGVDNFTQDRLADFMFWNKIRPMVNLLECNPWFQREDEKEYLGSQNILLEAWSPLAAGQNDIFHNELLGEIGRAHGKTPAQVVLRWLVQRGIVPLVKSANVDRMRENLEIFDFTLTKDEMDRIKELDTGHTCFVPRNTGKAVENFLTQAITGHAPSGKVNEK